MIVVVRHGRTAANARGLLLGRADPDLDAEGRAQAARLGAVLRELDVVRVVTSPLGRCRQTAAIVAEAWTGAAGRPTAGRSTPGLPAGRRLPVDVDERWIELDYGSLDGLASTELPADVWEAWRADVGWVPGGGESLVALGARVRAACDDLVPEARDRDVVVVTHVSPVKAAVAWALDVSDHVSWRLWVAPASITRITVGGPTPVLRSFNEVAHLA